MAHFNEERDRRKLAILQKIRHDPWEFSKYVFTKDESDKNSPKKRFPYNKAYVKLYFRILQKETRVAVPKSRRMMMTWINVIFHLWDAMFHEGRHIAIVSKKEDDADWLLQKRFKYIYENLDPIIDRSLIPKMEDKYCLLEFPEIGSVLQGFPQGADQLRMYTLSRIFADELAFWAKAEETYSASLPTLQGGGSFVGISSPAPGFFKKLCLDQLEMDEATNQKDSSIQEHFPMKGVKVWRNKINEFFVMELHYTADPDKRSPEFIAEASKGMSKKRFNQEYELQWETYAGFPVFSDFNKEVHGSKEKLEPHIGLPLLRGWDFGLTPACVIAQLQGQKLVVLKEFTAMNMGADRFSDIVLEQCALLYPYWSNQKDDFMDFIDPSGYFRKDTDEQTCAMILNGKGMNCIPGEVTWEARRGSVEYYLTRFTKGEPNLQINLAECPVLERGFTGGYRYPDKFLEEEPGKIRPIKDEHSHAQDALQMITSKIKQIVKRQRRRIPRASYSYNR